MTPQALDLRRTPQAQAATSRAELPPRVLSCDFRSYERAGFLDEQEILDRERRRDAVLRHLGSLPGDTIMEPLHNTVNSSWEAAERRAEAMEARRKLEAAVLIPRSSARTVTSAIRWSTSQQAPQ